MLYLYEVTPPEDNNDSEVKGAYVVVNKNWPQL